MSPDPIDRRERQALLEFGQRAERGTYLHLPMWLLIAGSIRLDRSAPGLFWLNAGVMLLVLLTRREFYRRQPRLLELRPAAGRLAGQVAVLVPALHWSLLAASSVRGGVLHPLLLPFMFIVAGMASAGTIVLAIDRAVRIWYPILMLLPLDVALLLDSGGSDWLVPIMSVGFVLYVVSATRVVHQEYWAAIDARGRLEERAVDLEVLSLTDSLTQIPNRLHFERRLAKAWSRAVHERRPLSLLLLDLDHFKAINDTYGHSCGDLCLKSVAVALQRGMHRADDLVARWGGEEFIVLLQDMEAPAAATVAHRLLRAVAGTVVDCGGIPVPLACSIGSATLLPEAASEWSMLVNEADRALYVAKQAGRNRVIAVAA